MARINQKYHYDKNKTFVSKQDIEDIEARKINSIIQADKSIEEINKQLLERDDSCLVHVKGRIIVKFDLDGKNTHTFSFGQKIRHEREYNNLNRRETKPVNAIVVNSEYVPIGSEILVHHNSCHPVNQIFNYLLLSSKESASTVKYFSVPEDECFFYREKNSSTWKPCNGWATALRVYEPIKTMLIGIEPKLVKNVLFVTSGGLKNKVCHVVKASDYEIIFLGIDGVEQRFIRLRNFNDKKIELKYKNIEFLQQTNEREEIIAINNNLTKKVLKGELLIGLDSSKAVKYGSESKY